MNIKLKPPCWVKTDTGDVLRCRRVSRANARMKHERKWKGLVAHVQNENGTGLIEYHRLSKPTDADLAAVNARIKRMFGI